MKQLITSAMALSLLMGGNALAQDKDKHGGGKHQGGQQQQQQQSHQGGGGKHNDRPPQSGGPNPYAPRVSGCTDRDTGYGADSVGNGRRCQPQR